MYNTLYEDDDHGLEIWREREARKRAFRICRKAGLRVSAQHLDLLDSKQIRRIIREGLGVLEAMESLPPEHGFASRRARLRERNS